MKETDYLNYINNYFAEREIPVSNTAVKAFLGKHLNRELLHTLPRKTITNNLDILLQDITDQYLSRSLDFRRKGKIRGVDALPVLKKRFCRLPPFCRKPQEERIKYRSRDIRRRRR